MESCHEFLDVLPLVVPSPRVFEIAQPLHRDQGVSFWDAMVLAACLDCGVKTLYSEDVPAVDLGAAMKIVNPFA
jgi:predicted nucleic acid-binding protein